MAANANVPKYVYQVKIHKAGVTFNAPNSSWLPESSETRMQEDVTAIRTACQEAYTKQTPWGVLDDQLKKVPDESKVRWEFRFEWPEEHMKGNPVTDHQVLTVIAEAYPPDADVNEDAIAIESILSKERSSKPSICERSEFTADPGRSSYQDSYGSTPPVSNQAQGRSTTDGNP